jgi:outer membrane lipoprotein-sorting protein
VAEAPGQGNVNKETIYNSFTEYNGVKFPSSMTSSGGGQVVEITIEKVEVNPKLKSKVFKVD